MARSPPPIRHMSLLSSLQRTSLVLSLAARAYRTPVCFGTNAILEGEDGRVLLVRHRYMPGLYFPGGGIDSGEAPAETVLRELREEVGLSHAKSVALFGLYTRKVGWTTNVIAVYRVEGGQIDFRPSLEISEIVRADPHAPPPDTSPATRRRLAEWTGAAPVSPYW
jgi:8-oxo-dGTP pyrophosphatase MutT (NUDIX family)